MAACCSTFERAAEQQFTEKLAARELKRFRTKGPGATTQLLAEGIARARRVNGSLLDVGCGIGSLTFELMSRGVAHAVAVDASSAYIDVARQEAERLGLSSAVRFVHADFVSVATEMPAATIVTLDRVVCCYPAYEPLLDAALRRAGECLALSYPRDVWYVRMGVRLENGQRRLSGRSFRTFVHPVAEMQATINRAGFTLSSRRQTWIWSVDVYVRTGL